MYGGPNIDRVKRMKRLEAGGDPVLTGDVVQLARPFDWRRYLKITALLRRDDWNVNHKRMERIWRWEGLKVPSKQLKRARLWLNYGSCIRRTRMVEQRLVLRRRPD